MMWQFGGVTLYQGNCMEMLPTLPAQSVQACITSPPYWGLRDYGTARWEGGDSVCEHIVGNQVQDNKWPGAITSGIRPGTDASTCRKCGAIRFDQQLGLERVPDCLGWATKQPCGECYVCHTVAWAREVRRVLRDDGVMFLVLGDSYASIGHKKSNSGYDSTGLAGGIPQTHSILYHENNGSGLKHKDLCGIPWRVALALQADGWWLRSDVIWAKPNPMPESVTDRPTKAHEYVFILTKSARYYWDAEAVKEPAQIWTGQAGRWERSGPVSQHILPGQSAAQHRPSRNGHNAFRGQGSNREGENGPALREGRDMSGIGTDPNRNIRTVWTVATRPFSGAHFAVFPEALIEPMVKAATKPGDTILDHFGGSGTVASVALRLGRRAILCELNPDYIELQKERIEQTQPALPMLVEA